MSTTLLQAATKVATRLADSNNLVWTATELKQWVKKAHRKFVSDTRVLWTSNLYDDVAGTGTMNLPSDLLLLTAVTWASYSIPNRRAVDLIRRDPNWRTMTGDVQAYCVDGDGVGDKVPPHSGIGMYFSPRRGDRDGRTREDRTENEGLV